MCYFCVRAVLFLLIKAKYCFSNSFASNCILNKSTFYSELVFCLLVVSNFWATCGEVRLLQRFESFSEIFNEETLDFLQSVGRTQYCQNRNESVK